MKLGHSLCVSDSEEGVNYLCIQARRSQTIRDILSQSWKKIPILILLVNNLKQYLSPLPRCLSNDGIYCIPPSPFRRARYSSQALQSRIFLSRIECEFRKNVIYLLYQRIKSKKDRAPKKRKQPFIISSCHLSQSFTHHKKPEPSKHTKPVKASQN